MILQCIGVNLDIKLIVLANSQIVNRLRNHTILPCAIHLIHGVWLFLRWLSFYSTIVRLGGLIYAAQLVITSPDSARLVSSVRVLGLRRDHHFLRWAKTYVAFLMRELDWRIRIGRLTVLAWQDTRSLLEIGLLLRTRPAFRIIVHVYCSRWTNLQLLGWLWLSS